MLGFFFLFFFCMSGKLLKHFKVARDDSTRGCEPTTSGSALPRPDVSLVVPVLLTGSGSTVCTQNHEESETLRQR